MRESTLLFAAFIGVVFGSGGTWAKEIHVSKAGSDSASGSDAQPYLSINKAASAAQPGDTVVVHAGTYREWVKPVRGGTDDGKRIIYRAAPGEEVFVKGSERITSWKPEADGVWKVELPNSFFGQYNPYALTLSGGWLNYGQWHHRGDVYLNGEAFYEKQTAQELTGAERAWFCQVEGDVSFLTNLNPNSLQVLKGCKVEPMLGKAEPGARYQFERVGYFCADIKDSKPGAPVFNRIVTLKDTWAKIQQRQT